MSLRSLATKIAPAARSIHTSARVDGEHHSTRGIFGSNLPLPVHNRYALFACFVVYFSSGLAVPFLSLRRMILLKNQS